MSAFHFYASNSPEYAADFQTLLGCLGERPATDALLHQVLAPYGPDAVAVDWGAGSGDLTSRLLGRFQTVYAVEPNAALAAVLTETCKQATILQGTLAAADIPVPVDVGFLRHVLYHLPDHQWGAHVLRLAARLSQRGVLVVTLKHPDTACNAMLAAFGAPPFNLLRLDDTFRRHPEYRVEKIVLPGPIVTRTQEETFRIARFMLADREPAAYARSFTEEEVRAYVAKHLWNAATGSGGWRCDALTYLIRRNEFWEA